MPASFIAAAKTNSDLPSPYISAESIKLMSLSKAASKAAAAFVGVNAAIRIMPKAIAEVFQ